MPLPTTMFILLLLNYLRSEIPLIEWMFTSSKMVWSKPVMFMNGASSPLTL